MARRIRFSLTMDSIRQAQKELREYRDSLVAKCQIFVQRLAECGIAVAQQNAGEYGNHIAFIADVDQEKYGAKGVMIAMNTDVIISRWITTEGEQSAEVSPLMMAEFGSGLRGEDNPRAAQFGMGTGTFPGQTHAEDPNGWWYMDAEDEQWHHSYGVTPGMPVYKAAMEMREQINAIAREVFGS